MSLLLSGMAKTKVVVRTHVARPHSSQVRHMTPHWLWPKQLCWAEDNAVQQSWDPPEIAEMQR